MATFASRLQEALDMNHMTAAELARKTGISKGAISQYLSGAIDAKKDKAKAISQVLNVSQVWLMALDVPTQEELDEEVKAVFNSLPTHLQLQAISYLHFLAGLDKPATPEESPESP